MSDTQTSLHFTFLEAKYFSQLESWGEKKRLCKSFSHFNEDKKTFLSKGGGFDYESLHQHFPEKAVGH